MSQPAEVHVKSRKRAWTDDAGPEAVILTSPVTGKKVRYVKRLKKDDKKTSDDKKASDDGQTAPFFEPAKAPPRSSPRVFHLQATTVPTSLIGKKRKGEDAIATFVEERRSKNKRQGGQASVNAAAEQDAQPEAQPETAASVETFKRPGRGSAVHKSASATIPAETAEEKEQARKLADRVQREIFGEAAQDSASKTSRTPKLSGARSRELHHQRMAASLKIASEDDVEMESDDDFVTEVYVLSEPNAENAVMHDAGEQIIGHLVIAEEHQGLWELYQQGDESDKEGYSDDEDENAEDYYGADYPEDEVGSDDENGRNAYGYRAKEEEWDDETGTYSDDEDNRMMNPFDKFKLAQRKLARAQADGHDSD